jgi:putative membrane protein
VTAWTFDPWQLGPVLIAGGVYLARAVALRRRGRPVPMLRVVAFLAGLATLALALVSPIDSIGEERLFAVHMLQHLLIGDVAPLLIVLGLTGPLLRPVLALRPLAGARRLLHPAIVLPVWAANLALWHVPSLYDAALEDDLVHALQHSCFFGAGLVLWTLILGLLPAPRWYGAGARFASLAFVWVAGGVVANVLLWSTHAFYQPYVDAPRTWGISALTDQRTGGGIMLLEMTIVVTGAFVLMGLRWLDQAEARQAREDERRRRLRRASRA